MVINIAIIFLQSVGYSIYIALYMNCYAKTHPDLHTEVPLDDK